MALENTAIYRTAATLALPAGPKTPLFTAREPLWRSKTLLFTAPEPLWRSKWLLGPARLLPVRSKELFGPASVQPVRSKWPLWPARVLLERSKGHSGLLTRNGALKIAALTCPSVASALEKAALAATALPARSK